jgi:hypothetical protein
MSVVTCSAGESLQDAGCLERRELLAGRRGNELRQPVEHCWRRPVLPLAVRDEVPGPRKGRLPAPDQASDVIEMPVRDDDNINVCRLGADARELRPKPTALAAERMLGRAQPSVDENHH